MGKKKKFDLTKLVHQEKLQDGQELYFVSDPSKTCKVTRQPNGEFKVVTPDGAAKTLHACATEFLGTDPPEHASKWIRTEGGQTLYELWHADDELDIAA